MLILRLISILLLLSISPSIAQAVGRESSDKQFVIVRETTELTNKVLPQVMIGVGLLPPAIKQKLQAFGIKVVITPSHFRFNGETGHSEYESNYKQVLICERDADGSPSNVARMPITTLHELGHAYDHMLGYPSRKDEFQTIYLSEAARVPAEDRRRLDYFLQPGRPGSRETFASLFACRFFHEGDRRLDMLKKNFPQTFALVQRY